MSHRQVLVGLWLSLLVGAIAPAHASVHFMQVQRVIGGVDGDTTAQAVQLRMRSSLQTQTQQSQLVVRNALGRNPVVIASPLVAVPNGGAGVTVLFATAAFSALTDPPAVPDFTMTAIPASYLAAGSLTFESKLGDIYWRISWGGPSYTGDVDGTTFNDFDGIFSPNVATGLPVDDTVALDFNGAATALSSNNAADYSISAPLASFTNNAGTVFTLMESATPAPIPQTLVAELHPAFPNPFNPRTTLQFDLPQAGEASLRVYALDGSLVDVLHEGLLPAGVRSVTWNGTDAAGRLVGSGIYLVRLSTPMGIRSQSVTLIK